MNSTIRYPRNIVTDTRGCLFRSTLATQPGGTYRITGTVTELGVAGAYLVRLFDRASGWLLAETQSAADGSYVFNDLAYRANGYFAVAYDHGDNLLNAAIKDLITPEAMP